MMGHDWVGYCHEMMAHAAQLEHWLVVMLDMLHANNVGILVLLPGHSARTAKLPPQTGCELA